MTKKKNSDGIYFLGESSVDVTGSQYLINFGNKKILLECGLYQSNDYLESYRVNSKKFKFKPSEIDYLFVCHTHIDHIGLIPRLVSKGFNGKIITTEETGALMKPLLSNCVYILSEEARILSKKFKREYEPIYNEKDVYKTLSMITTYKEYNKIFNLDENISFQWLKNSHCLGAAQLQLILSDELKTKKVLYSSDIGSFKTKNHYVENTEIPKMFNDVTIMESTYGDKTKINKKSRNKDIEHMKVAVETTLNRNGTVIFPCFSFSRTQEILTVLYELFGNNEDFNYDVVVDSKLSCDICLLYEYLLNGKDYDKYIKVYDWKKVKYISEKDDSKLCIADKKPKIIISSSGFCTNGRVVSYLQKYLSDPNSTIIFSGYTGDNPSYLSYRIKNYKDFKKICINHISVDNKADCISLSSFSSHANRNELIEYGSNLNTNRLVLVHGSEASKKSLSESLKEEIFKNNKTYKVSCSNLDMFVSL